jgi:prepilin-type N-terminal cleavage/methylation domain-containing protein
MRRCSHEPRSGFTLIEVLIVIMLLSIIGLGLASSFISGLTLWDRAQNEDAATVQTLLGLEQVTQELRQSVKTELIPFTSEEKGFSFPTLRNHSVIQVSYLFDARHHVLKRREIALDEIVKEKLEPHYEEEALFPLDEWQVEYFLEAPDDLFTRQGTWKDTWDEEDGIPIAIRLNVQFKDQTFAKVVFIPVA